MHPLEFWNRLREWRAVVDADATRLKTAGRLPVTRNVMDDARGELVDRLFDSSLSTSEWSQRTGIAIVAGLDDVVVRSARERRTNHTEGRIAGSSGVVWVSSLQSARRSGIDTLRRLFSLLRPSSYPPAQYTKIVLPPWHGRPRFVDDGSQRIGG